MATATLPTPVRCTLDDLMQVEGKAELINGRIVTEMPGSRGHGRISARIMFQLQLYIKDRACGEVLPDNTGYRVPELLSGRESFCPDVGYVEVVSFDDDESFVDGPPTFAVEVRSPDQYGPQQEAAMAEKRDDYFEAGTRAVWDVDPQAQTVTLHRPLMPPLVFRRGEAAHAEPVLPGWNMEVNAIFN